MSYEVSPKKLSSSARVGPRYKCPVCPKVFKYMYSLRHHHRVHTEERPFVCRYPNCRMSFKWRSSLKNHDRKHPQQPSARGGRKSGGQLSPSDDDERALASSMWSGALSAAGGAQPPPPPPQQQQQQPLQARSSIYQKQLEKVLMGIDEADDDELVEVYFGDAVNPPSPRNIHRYMFQTGGEFDDAPFYPRRSHSFTAGSGREDSADVASSRRCESAPLPKDDEPSLKSCSSIEADTHSSASAATAAHARAGSGSWWTSRPA